MLLTLLALHAAGLVICVQLAALIFVLLTGSQHFMRPDARQHCLLAFCPSVIAHHQQLRHSCLNSWRVGASLSNSNQDTWVCLVCEEKCCGGVCVCVCVCVAFASSDFYPMALQAGRLKVVESHASVYVRVCDAQRMGSVEGPANEAGAQPFLRVPPYVQEGSRVQYDMQTVKTGGRTYDNAR